MITLAAGPARTSSFTSTPDVSTDASSSSASAFAAASISSAFSASCWAWMMGEPTESTAVIASSGAPKSLAMRSAA